LRRDHGGEPGPGHGDSTLRRQSVCRLHGGANIHRAVDPQPGPLRVGDLWLPDDHHLRTGNFPIPEGTGVRLSTCSAAAEHVAVSCQVRRFQNGGSSSKSCIAVAGTAAAVFTAFFAADFVAVLLALAAVFLAAFLAAFAAVPVFAAVLPAALVAVFLPGFSGRGSNSKPILPSFCVTRNALNLRLVRDETKPVSRSVLPSVSSLRICSGAISCWRITLPLRKVQLFSGPTDFSHR